MASWKQAVVSKNLLPQYLCLAPEKKVSAADGEHQDADRSTGT